MFRRAAYYDSQAAHVPFQAIKEGGNRNQIGANPDEFRRVLAGEDEPAQNEGPNDGVTLNTRDSIRRSSATEEGHVVNIGIVEVN